MTAKKRKPKQYQCMCCSPGGSVCPWTGPAEEMVVVEMVDPAERGSFHACFGQTAREMGFPPFGTAVERLGVSRECAEMLVAEEDDDGKPNSWRQWVRIVAGDPTQHADDVDGEDEDDGEL